MKIDSPKLEKIQKELKIILCAALSWVKQHKALTAVSIVVTIFLTMFVNACVRNHRMTEERLLLQARVQREQQERQAQILREQQERQAQILREQQERQAQLQREEQTRELYRLLRSSYINEDNFENRKVLKRIRELISTLGVDVKNDESESLLYCAYKNNLPEMFVSTLKESGATLTDDEAFEVNRKKEAKKRKAIEDFLKDPQRASYAISCIELGVNLADFDVDKKESLLFKSLHSGHGSVSVVLPFSVTECSGVLKKAGLNFRPEEERLILEKMTKEFWSQICYFVRSSWNIDAGIENTTFLIEDITRFEVLGIDAVKVLNSPKPECVQIKVANYEDGTALFFVKLEMIEALKREIREMEDDEDRMKSKKLERLVAFLEKSGATLRSEEKEYLANKTKELELVAVETELKTLAKIFKVTSREMLVSTEEFGGMLSRLKDLRKYEQGVGSSLLHNAFYWEIVLPEEIKVPEGGWTFCSEHDNYLRRVTSPRYPLEKDKIDLLKKYGAVFKKGEEDELKRNAKKWLVGYLLSDISRVNGITNLEKFVWTGGSSEETFRPARDLLLWADPLGLNKYFVNLFSPTTVERVFPPLLELCGSSLPSEIVYSNFEHGRVRLTLKYFQNFGGELARIFSENEKRDKHSLLYIAWDKCYPKEVLELLRASGVRYINEEEAIVTGLEKAQGTVYLSRLVTDSASKATVGELRSILVRNPDVNATFNGHSILWHAKKNGLGEALIDLLEDVGAKLAPGE